MKQIRKHQQRKTDLESKMVYCRAENMAKKIFSEKAYTGNRVCDH